MSKRVLVVDDSVFMRDIIKDIFAAGGFDVVGEAGNGVEAVEKYKELKPDIVTMDLVMPYRNGIESIEKVGPAPAQGVGGIRGLTRIGALAVTVLDPDGLDSAVAQAFTSR